jgi:PAS domain-containing protein
MSVPGTAEDITEQKRIREELIETRRRGSSALIAGEIATYEWDVASDRLWGDANFDLIFGTQRDADGTAPLARFVEAIHPDDREHVMREVNRTVDTGADYETEYRILNGSAERWVSARGQLERHDGAGIVRFHGVVLDITRRRHAEQELQRRTRLYDTFLSGTDDLAYLIDREGRFLFANRALLTLWGRTLQEVSGRTLYDLGYPKWHADMNMPELAQVVETKKTITGVVFRDARTRAMYGVSEGLQAYGDVLARMVPEDASRIDAAIRAATDPADPQPYDVEYRLRMPDGSLRWIASRGLAIAR